MTRVAKCCLTVYLYTHLQLRVLRNNHSPIFSFTWLLISRSKTPLPHPASRAHCNNILYGSLMRNRAIYDVSDTVCYL